jgi:hypothetical protein
MAADLTPGDARLRPASSAAGARHFMDPDGVAWTVTEVDGATVPGARGAACLVFEAGHVIRRVWNYPDDWRSLPPEALLAVSWQR